MLTHKFTFRSLFATILVCLVCVSCQKDDLHQEDENQVKQELPKEALATLNYLNNLGYSQDDFTPDFENRTLVNNDFAISFDLKLNLDKNSGNAQEKNQNYRNANVNYRESRDISYYINSNFPKNQINPLAWASYHWSRVSPNINIRRTYTRSRADIIVGVWTNPNTAAWARADLPNGSGKVGTWLFVNLAKNHDGQSNEAKMTLLMHEFGHNLGFLHSDQTAGYNIPGTANAAFHIRNNCGSIMRSTVYKCNWRLSGRSSWSGSDWTAIHWAYKLY